MNFDNNVDVSVYKGEVKLEFCGTLKLTDGLEQSDQIYTLICNTEGDTVKFSKKSGRISVYEVVVLKSKAKEPEGNYKLTCRPILHVDPFHINLENSYICSHVINNHTYQAKSQGSS